MENLEESGLNEPVGSYYVELELKEAQILIQEDYIYNKDNSSKSAWIQPEIKGNEIISYIRDFINLASEKTLVFKSRLKSDVLKTKNKNYFAIVNLQKINDIAQINKFFEAVNDSLPVGGLFAGCVETYWDRQRRMFGKFPKPVFHFLEFIDFVFSRVFPRVFITKKIYFLITRGKNRAISKAEALGRLVSCGFEILDYKHIEGLKYFIARKIKQPLYDMNPSYGPVFKMKRLGKNAEIIQVYKFRTMHPYSEYLQEFIFKSNQLDEGGKFKNDFRISVLGSFMRKYWIDEIPMIVNMLKGNMKLVGVRPLSPHYFSLYSKELQEKRIRVKPGLIPPFYADMPKNLDEIMASELKYIEAYEKNPFLTDFRYFWKSIINIFFRNARSK